MGLLVTEVTGIEEKIYVITCIRPGRYKLFPQLVISFSLTSLDFVRSRDQPKRNWDHLTKIRQRGWANSHDFTAAILVFQANPVRVGLFVCKKFSCSHKFAWMLATWVNTLYTKNVKFERDLWTTNEEYRYAKSPNCVRGTRTQPLICFWCSVHYWVTCAINKGVTEINTLNQIIGKVMDMSRTHVPLNVLIGLVRSLNSDVKAFKPVNSM